MNSGKLRMFWDSPVPPSGDKRCNRSFYSYIGMSRYSQKNIILKLHMKKTNICFNRPDHRLYTDIDISRLSPTLYVIVDPADPNGLLYLSEREYLRLANSAIRSDQVLLVLLRPGESLSPPHPSVKEDGESSQEGSPKHKPLSVAVKETRGFSILRGIRSAFLRYLSFYRQSRGSASSDQLLVLTHRNVQVLLRAWGKILMLRSGSPYHSLVHLNLLTQVVGHFSHTFRHHGVQQIILRMKASLYAVNCYLAGNPVKDTRVQKHAVALSHGLPSFLPADIRRAIRQRRLPFIRLYCSLLGSYRGIKGEYGRPDYSTIESPPFIISDKVMVEVMAFVPYFWHLIETKLSAFPSLQAKELYQTSKAGPNDPQALVGAVFDCLAWSVSKKTYLLEYLKLTNSTVVLNAYNSVMEEAETLSRIFGSPVEAYRALRRLRRDSLSLGKLALKEEPAGKLRVFAIVDYWTQCAMEPLHKRLSEALKVLAPIDATYDQEGAVKSFVDRHRAKGVYSFDLSAATDTIPVALSEVILAGNIGTKLAKLWRLILTDRSFSLPHREGVVETRSSVRYTRGQPIGALSSWNALAITHHFVVQLAAKRLHQFPTGSYRVLGDDIVIGGSLLAQTYQIVANDLGLVLNNKGIISPRTDGEAITNFANQTFLGKDNISPIPLSEELSITTLGARVESVRRLLNRGFQLPEEGYFKSLSRFANVRISRMRQDMSNLSAGSIPRAIFGLLVVLTYPSNSRYEDQSGPWSTTLALCKGQKVVYGSPQAFQDPSMIHFNMDKLGFGERTLTRLLSSTYASVILTIDRTLKALWSSHSQYDEWRLLWDHQWNLFLSAAYAANNGDHIGRSVIRDLDVKKFPIFAHWLLAYHAEMHDRALQLRAPHWGSLRESLINEERMLSSMPVTIHWFSAKMSSLNEILKAVPIPWQYSVTYKHCHASNLYKEGMRRLVLGGGQRLLAAPLGLPNQRIVAAWRDLRLRYDLFPDEWSGIAWKFVGFYTAPIFKKIYIPLCSNPLDTIQRNERTRFSIGIPFRQLESGVQDLGVQIDDQNHLSTSNVSDSEWFSRTTFPWVGK